jgi:hypothetical protein
MYKKNPSDIAANLGILITRAITETPIMSGKTGAGSSSCIVTKITWHPKQIKMQ